MIRGRIKQNIGKKQTTANKINLKGNIICVIIQITKNYKKGLVVVALLSASSVSSSALLSSYKLIGCLAISL